MAQKSSRISRRRVLKAAGAAAVGGGTTALLGGAGHWPDTGGGTNDRRDSPRYVRLIETGQINMKVLAARTFSLSQAREAYQVCADRDVPATIVTPTA